MIPRELCHYTKRETALEKILLTKQIKLGKLGNTNDPKETKARSVQIFSNTTDHIYKDYEKFKLDKYIEQVTKNEWRVFCLTKSRRRIKGTSIKAAYHNLFSPGYSRPRMWAQYGDNHAGVCLIFDGKQLAKRFEKLNNKTHMVFHGSVSYGNYDIASSKIIKFSDVNSIGALNAIRKHYCDYWDYYFLSKHPDWRDETEYRWLIHSTNQNDEFIDIQDVLRGVLVGTDFPQVYEATLRELCKELNVWAGRMIWTNGFPIALPRSIYDPDTKVD